jgi:hypothetical protein
MPLGRWQLSETPEKQLEEFLASKPAWMQRFLQTSIGLLSPDDTQEWGNNLGEAMRAKDEHERILQLMPAKWKEYRKRQEAEAQPLIQLLIPKGKPGRPPDSKAQEYFEQHSGDLSYADIAKQEVQQELQSVSDAEAKALLIKKESERIRQSVRRSRRRQSE